MSDKNLRTILAKYFWGMPHSGNLVSEEIIDSIHAAIAKDKEENNSSCTTET